MAARVAQYVTVIDRSNKVIGNSKQFKDVFLEAKVAYQERKAEIKARKKAKEEVELQKALRAMSVRDEDDRSTVRPCTQRRHESHHSSRAVSPGHERPRNHRMHSNVSERSQSTTYGEDRPRQMLSGDFDEQVYNPHESSSYRRTSHTVLASPVAWDNAEPGSRGLVRARTEMALDHRRPPYNTRSYSADGVDLDLAYGEYNPECLVVTSQEQKQKELNTLVAKCKGLLEEADCAGHSAKAIIANLQKNPDTLAAVGLTLAEISTIASKMAPGAMAMVAKSAPAVMALLISPQFLIAVGVSVGVTVIAIGGYKIVKRIQEKAGQGDKAMPGYDEAIDVRELDRIERWRRGVPDSNIVDDNATVVSGTSVEGEFISPFAAQSMGHLPLPSQNGRSKTVKKSSKDKDPSKKGEKKRRRKSGETSSVTSHDSESTIRRSSTSKPKDKSIVKAKKPSPLSRMFSHGTSVAS